MPNLEFYDKVRVVPPEAKREIKGGRLAGKTDINPMWRIKTLTDTFGPCGFGWKYEIVDKTLSAGASNEISAFVDINLYVKIGDEWSAAIPGTGGSAFVAKEKGGLYTSDECYKMALTDAISVACKALGVGADVYWEADRSKYDATARPAPPKPDPILCAECGSELVAVRSGSQIYTPEIIAKNTKQSYGRVLCWACGKAEKARTDAEQGAQ